MTAVRTIGAHQAVDVVDGPGRVVVRADGCHRKHVRSAATLCSAIAPSLVWPLHMSGTTYADRPSVCRERLFAETCPRADDGGTLRKQAVGEPAIQFQLLSDDVDVARACCFRLSRCFRALGVKPSQIRVQYASVVQLTQTFIKPMDDCIVRGQGARWQSPLKQLWLIRVFCPVSWQSRGIFENPPSLKTHIRRWQYAFVIDARRSITRTALCPFLALLVHPTAVLSGKSPHLADHRLRNVLWAQPA